VLCVRKTGTEKCVGSDQSQHGLRSLFFKTASKATQYGSKAQNQFARNVVFKSVYRLVVSNAVFSADNIPLQPVLNAFAIFRLFGFIHSSRSFGENFNILMRSTCEKGHPPLGREFD